MFKQGDLCYASANFEYLGDLRELNSYKNEYDRLSEIDKDEAGDIFIFLRKDSVGFDREEVYVVYSIKCGKTGWLFTDELVEAKFSHRRTDERRKTQTNSGTAQDLA